MLKPHLFCDAKRSNAGVKPRREWPSIQMSTIQLESHSISGFNSLLDNAPMFMTTCCRRADSTSSSVKVSETFKPSSRRDGSSLQHSTLSFTISAIQQQVVITQLHLDSSLARAAQGLTPELTRREELGEAFSLANNIHADSARVE